MNSLTTNTLANDVTASITTGDISSCIQSITDKCSGSVYYSPLIYDPYNYTITTSAYPTKLEIDSNELKINIKKFQIKFNFNL